MTMKRAIFGAFASLLLLSSAGTAGPVLDRIKSTGVIKVSTAGTWPPQSFINDKNELDGFDVDVAKEIAKRLGANVEFVTPEWSVITAGHWMDRWDMSVGSMTPTKARAEVLSFPGIYYYTPAAFAVHAEAKITDKAELNGKTIGVVAPSTFEQYLNGDLVIDAEGTPEITYDVKPTTVVTMPNNQQIFDDLRLGDGVRMDGLLDSLPAINDAIKNGYPIKVVGTPAFYEPLAVAIDKGDPEFNDALATIISDMHADGTMTTLSMKWYGFDYSKTSSE
jgi:polar amino acid transport system substrate-binding protein